MKRILSLMLALVMALALAVPASADGEDIGIIGGADGPTYILVSADPKASATVSKEQREQSVEALGGTVGQTNVLLNDKCISFTDAAPEAKNGRTMVPLRATLEAMGATVDYEQATKTVTVTGEKASFTHVIGSDVITLSDGTAVKMDVASYSTPSNRTMVPVRFFSQVLGYDVYWDNDYKLVFLLDEAVWTARTDSGFTVLNEHIAKSAETVDLTRSQKQDVTMSGTLRLTGENGQTRSAYWSGAVSALMGKEGAALRVTADLENLLTLFPSDGSALPAELRAPLADLDFEIRYAERLYARSPLLNALMERALGGDTKLGADTWYAADTQGMSFAALYSALYGGAKSSTVGSMLYAALRQGDANHFFRSWTEAEQTRALLEALVGDKFLTRSGSRCTRHIGMEELAALYQQLGTTAYGSVEGLERGGLLAFSLDLTLRTDGSAETALSFAAKGADGTPVRLSCTVSDTGRTETVSGSLQAEGKYDLIFRMTGSTRATSEPVAAVPPEGAAVLDLAALTQPGK